MNRHAPLILLALGGAVLSGTVLAQAASPLPTSRLPASPLRLALTQELVTTVTENGRTSEKLVPMPRGVQPGDTLTQQLSVSNVGRVSLNNAGINLPVPQGTVYLGGAGASSARWTTLYSRDGGKTFGAAPLKKLVSVTENGRTVQREVAVPPSEYTNVRWVIKAIEPAETLKLGFRVKVK